MADAFSARGDEVVILTRSRRPDLPHRQLLWDGRTPGDWATELNDAIVVNLAGKLVDCRPTPTNIELLTQSRVLSTLALVAASAQPDCTPKLWLQMSTLAIYGDAGEDVIAETHPPADGPPQMAGVAQAWEAAVTGANADRVVVMRTGIVLDPGTPAFELLRKLTRFGLGGPVGSGRQWVSWIHLEDFLNVVQFLCDRPDISGVVHVTAPNPVRNRDMMRAFRVALRRPWSPPTPKAAVRLGAVFLRSDPALGLTGRRCIPERLDGFGFSFTHPRFDEAVQDLIANPR
jgi:uncharacterized protein (TIGR01777 family)